MVHPLREWYLLSIGLYPTEFHHLLAQIQLACQSLTLGIGIHSCQLCIPATTISYTISSFHRSFPIQNSKEIQDILAKESGVIFLKKSKKKKKRSPLSISSCKLWSSNKWEAIHSIHSIPSKNPMFHETWIWQSTDCRCLPPSLLRDTLSSKVCRQGSMALELDGARNTKIQTGSGRELRNTQRPVWFVLPQVLMIVWRGSLPALIYPWGQGYMESPSRVQLESYYNTIGQFPLYCSQFYI